MPLSENSEFYLLKSKVTLIFNDIISVTSYYDRYILLLLRKFMRFSEFAHFIRLKMGVIDRIRRWRSGISRRTASPPVKVEKKCDSAARCTFVDC